VKLHVGVVPWTQSDESFTVFDIFQVFFEVNVHTTTNPNSGTASLPSPLLMWKNFGAPREALFLLPAA
jgi:hypothetical protein